jgi:hypothetical protein
MPFRAVPNRSEATTQTESNRSDDPTSPIPTPKRQAEPNRSTRLTPDTTRVYTHAPMPTSKHDATPKEDEPQADPTADWPHWAAGALESLRMSPSISAAGRTIGISRVTIHRLMQKDEAFALAVHDAREEALDTLEEVILARARQGQPVEKIVTKTDADGNVETTITHENHISDTLAMFFLKRWRPEYRESYRIEQSGPGGGPIQIEVEGRLNDAVERFQSEVVRLAAIAAEDETP